MLLNIHIKNMALIDEIDIDFSDNLNILTGETGAGKSIVIDSIMLALGGKTPKDFVRGDAEYGLVELLFSIESPGLLEKLGEYDIPDLDSGQIILSRKVMGTRSVSKINGETVTLTKIREIAALLLDLHAQHEHQSLLIPENHMKLLDRYGQDSILLLKEQVIKLYQAYCELKKEWQDNAINAEEKARQLDLMEFEKNEIKSAALKIGEDEEIEEQYKKASNGKNITDSLSCAYQYIQNVSNDSIDRALREMTAISEYDKELGFMADSLATISDLICDFERNARQYLEENTFSEEAFRALEDRLNTINHLKSKYGKSIEDVLAYEKELEKRYERLMNQEAYLDALKLQLKEKEEQLKEASILLSKERKAVAKKLTKEIKEALVDLNFLDVRFDMVFEESKSYTKSGIDEAYFVISTNVGEEMKPLWQVASGGELSRIMLAIKSCLAGADGIHTLIFDEIDVGISGRTAQMVAEKIYGIGKNHQVICITHLPQIAAYANHHYLIEKKVVKDKTITTIQKLNKNQEVQELARLIGGVEITDTVLKSAKEMKELASKAKVN